ncbi:MAG: molybdopterin-guanine dinucleotide biosynthesis protein B [Candidatus Kariarchaeaceae archaeon]|jgi:molybdopterin-guanine dinucleotide biosynthesis protein MobB
MFIKVIDVIGYSGSGKTYFIMNAIKSIKKQLSYNVAVIKNVKHHQIDKKGKDSFIFTESGASYSVIKNNHNDMSIFLNVSDFSMKELISWFQNGPYKLDLLLTEGFRDLNNPTVLCINNIEHIKPQLNDNIKMISGIICNDISDEKNLSGLPVVDIEKDFQKFRKIFNIGK